MQESFILYASNHHTHHIKLIPIHILETYHIIIHNFNNFNLLYKEVMEWVWDHQSTSPLLMLVVPPGEGARRSTRQLLSYQLTEGTLCCFGVVPCFQLMSGTLLWWQFSYFSCWCGVYRITTFLQNDQTCKKMLLQTAFEENFTVCLSFI